MKVIECKECKSKDILITSNPKGEIFAIVCQECGWEYESEKFKSLAAQMDDIINDFDRADILKTKKKLV